jgi:chromosomal replication initiator protein
MLTGKSRSRDFVIPRQVAMYLIREILNFSFPEIARFFGKDHTTVIYSINRITSQLSNNDEIKNQIRDIRCNILDT